MKLNITNRCIRIPNIIVLNGRISDFVQIVLMRYHLCIKLNFQKCTHSKTQKVKEEELVLKVFFVSQHNKNFGKNTFSMHT